MSEAKAQPLSMFWLFFSPFGRISRQPYWLGMALSWCILLIAFNTTSHLVFANYAAGSVQEVPLETFINDMFAANPMLAPIVFVSKFVELALVMKRLQDRGITSLAALLLFLPFLNFVVVLVAGFLDSPNGPNRFGPHRNSRRFPKKR